MNEQLFLFPELDLKPKVIKGDRMDVADINVTFNGDKEIHRKSNRMVDKLRVLPRDTYFLFKKGEDGFPYVKNVKTGKILSKNTTRNQYPCLSIKGVAIACHRLFALAFIENDDTRNKTEVDHTDENKANYKLNNLSWMTSGKNSSKSRRK
jgi:hypothetical protein